MNKIEIFQKSLESFTGARYVVTKDCCTWAIQLCFRLLQITSCTDNRYKPYVDMGEIEIQ